MDQPSPVTMSRSPEDLSVSTCEPRYIQVTAGKAVPTPITDTTRLCDSPESHGVPGGSLDVWTLEDGGGRRTELNNGGDWENSCSPLLARAVARRPASWKGLERTGWNEDRQREKGQGRGEEEDRATDQPTDGLLY
ncbi:unnamed protein product [Calypogeia fissa]